VPSNAQTSVRFLNRTGARDKSTVVIVAVTGWAGARAA
jgi:hypothetical protein